jgi:CRP-like cAMP-binding protein
MVGENAQNALIAKLSHFGQLKVEDVDLLVALCAKEESFAPRTNISTEGEPPRSDFVLTSGMACRYRLMPNGTRQLLTFLIPGDFCDLRSFLLRSMDHSIGTILETRIAAIGRQTVTHLFAHHPRIAAALRWSAMQEEAMLRERIVSLGRRNAHGRVAHLLCELVWRQMANGSSDNHAIRLPLTQTDLADALGLTSVHVNRVLQEFRRDRLITLARQRLKLLDVPKLQGIAEFNRDYLHLDDTPIEVSRYLGQLENDELSARKEL